MKPCIERRTALSLIAAGAASAAVGTRGETQERIRTSAHIVILGAGAAGTALANRLSRRLDGAQITIVDGREEHWYQPGFTLIATGLKPRDYAVSRTTDWLSRGVNLRPHYATSIDPESKTVSLGDGETSAYDYLIVATGLVLDHGAIEGFSLDLVGKEGIGALYAGPDFAQQTWRAAAAFVETGGVGLFTRPATEMKCAGAPLKHTFLVDDLARRAGTRGTMELTYAAHDNALFGVPIVSEKVRMLFGAREVKTEFSQVLQSLDPGARRAVFSTPGGLVEREYDYIHVIPPQRAPDVVRQSGLSWTDRWPDQGWVEVDQHSLRHRRYPEVFAAGDVAGVPKGKTAASAKWQVPVVEAQLVAQIASDTTDAAYTGYTSCPLITRVGRAMLIEFDYNNDLVPSFPGVVAPLEELWVSWLMKEVALKATYNAMLRGKA
ncbi:MAG: FAD/NAD(P)-binding oxidoreductase [Pseudomonadota bacterium]